MYTEVGLEIKQNEANGGRLESESLAKELICAISFTGTMAGGNDYKLQSSFGGRIFMGSNVSQSVAILPTCLTPMQCRLMGSWVVCSSIRFYICSRYICRPLAVLPLLLLVGECGKVEGHSNNPVARLGVE